MAKQKVTNNEILQHIWEKTLINICNKTLIRYIGNKIGTYVFDKLNQNDIEYLSIVSTVECFKGSGISQSQFRKRVKKLIEDGFLLKRLNSNNAFIINTLELEDAVFDAVEFWKNNGIPSGYEFDNEGKTACRTISAEGLNIEKLIKQNYENLLANNKLGSLGA
ncbi:hypothetical protein [Pasteurella multocida]|uniref:Uncharacterized protein n=1 Tax=Pasteurella multocida TaxID=747 RepID=A0AAW8VA14_PASMD|nr:hypothetical protein [Pasteurella multocida]MDH7436443.1 hypothetical protein [Pasteurella multocida]MDH7439756.1 hypothetical protein [Pasteurella multocida]MDT3453388.1 hypothetical protein [Pasteurella multocida]MDY0478862.1 hypothetical protein [Pasteurella multocida]MDY0494774.1 hypothetical protein [Pasteurella multocida]